MHWLVLLTPDPRIVHTAMSEDGGCPCPTMPYDFASVFTRTGQMFRSRTDPDGGVSYERLGADGFVFDPQASAELQQDDARKDALDVLASLTPEVPAHDAKVVAARGALGW
ncbi:hypothetical protein EON77_16720 [bacterium]|nr:MAG: hypothetical protein EON77_16720 [bacterium]